MSRCTKTCRQPKVPDGMPLEALRAHPTYRYYLEPGARCELDVGHQGAHQNGELSWHDPPLVEVWQSVSPARHDLTLFEEENDGPEVP
jgi:hypothetical protein